MNTASASGRKRLMERFDFWVRLEAVVMLVGLEIALKFFGLRRIGRFLEGKTAHQMVTESDPRIRHLANCVGDVAHFLPFRAACLHQSLAICWMLRRRDIRADFVMGVYKFPFSAHIWLECGSEIIYWRAGLSSCTGLTMLQSMSVIMRIGGQQSTHSTRRSTS